MAAHADDLLRAIEELLAELPARVRGSRDRFVTLKQVATAANPLR